MIEKINGKLEYEKLSPEEMSRRHILGRLVGVCADFINPTRNGRLYSQELWEKVFNNPIMKEKIKNKVVFGQFEHPTGEDVQPTEPEKIAICLDDQPKMNSEGKLVAVFNILDTCAGRILKTLCEYGSVLGVSSRGTGEVITDAEGNEMVDPDTYDCSCFDICALPAVKEARLQYVTESYNGKTLKQALKESYDSANKDQKKVMKETLEDLKINIKEDASDSSSEDKLKIVVDTVVNSDGIIEEDMISNDPEDQFDENVLNEWFDFIMDVETLIKTVGIIVKDSYSKATNSLSQYIDFYFKDNLGNKKDGLIDLRLSNHKQTSNGRKVRLKRASKIDTNVKFITITVNNHTFDTYSDALAYIREILHKEAKSHDNTAKINNMENKEEVKESVESGKIEEATQEPVSTPEQKVELKEGQNPVKDSDIVDSQKDSKKIEEAVNDRDEIVKNLTEALRVKAELEAKVKSLQEDLAVSNTKVSKLVEEANNYKFATARLSTKAYDCKNLNKKVSELEESLKSKTSEYNKLVESMKSVKATSKSLNESISKKDSEVSKLNESLTKIKSDYESKIKELNESITGLKTASEAKAKESEKQLAKANRLAESYKKLTKETVNKYIDSQALKLGVDSNEIVNRLPKSYTLKDIDSICESLQDYNLNISRLPIKFDKKVKVRVTESKHEELASIKRNTADDVDNSLLTLAGLDK